ncbi:MAG TPA: DUF2786 domain-containing protein [Terriglobia bacterium]|nr:DUF2786 domain-containing protein [Terriglobia bacterium]
MMVSGTAPAPERNEFLRAWTERLYVEHDRILFQRRLKLSTPVIRIEPVMSLWGHWNSAARAITLAERLIDNHPWDIVIDVFKHEMAHQLAHERWGAAAAAETAHGQSFQEACRLLGVPAWAASATGALPDEIPDWRGSQRPPEEERLLDRVNKLLALADSTNEYEAALAVDRVRELYAKYNIDRIRSGRPPAHARCVIGRKRRRIESAESAIFAILNAHFMVRAIFSSLYDAQDRREYKAVELLGTRENVLMAEYVYYFLSQKVQALWQDYQRRSRCSGAFRRSYMLGVLEGFRRKLDASSTADAGAESEIKPEMTRALLRQADRQLDCFVAERFPRLSRRLWGGGAYDRGAYGHGISDGGAITLRRGVTDRRGNRGRLLPEA